MPVQIKFGTSGWRGIMAEDFTFANVRRAVTGIARHISSRKPEGASIVVGRDPRFLGESLVGIAADILSAQGILARVIADPAPTPAIAWAVSKIHADGIINFTASHNPPEYNGIKFSTADGAPALPETTGAIEREIAGLGDDIPPGTARRRPSPEPLEVRADYLQRLEEVLDLDAIRKSGIRIAYDPLWGAGRGYPDRFLREHGIEVSTVHDVRDVLFGNHAPEPDDHLLGDLKKAMRETGANIGISTDGDADRFGILDSDGTFIQPNYVIALLFDYLVETRGWRNGVCKSVATTNLVNALAEHHAVPLHETPVGFKYIGELIIQDKIVIGGEESAGLSIRHHVPEKDGILAGLLMCEMVARRGSSIAEQLRNVFVKVGSFYPRRENFRLTPEVKKKFTTKLEKDPRDLGGRRVSRVVRTDGLKLLFDDGSWVCYRLSGTEPVVRVYSESRALEDLDRLSAAAKQWIFE